MSKITLIRPDDWHCHLRQGKVAEELIKISARHFGRITVMPNTKPPIKTVDEALDYRQTMIASMGEVWHQDFNPKMTLYLTDDTDPVELRKASSADFMIGAKLYPAGATTNSSAGVTQFGSQAPLWRMLEAMQGCGLPLLIHGELATGDVFDRERDFIESVLMKIRNTLPKLKIVLEHITTRSAVEFVNRWGPAGYTAATITAHHLLVDRNDMLANGMQPHLYCKPILKRSEDRQALVEAATSGKRWFFAGTDSAPHPVTTKESHCCAAGCFTALHAVELYAEVFFQHCKSTEKWHHFEQFMSLNGANFFRLPINRGLLTLEEIEHEIEDKDLWINDATEAIKPFGVGMKLHWKVIDAEA